MAYIGMALCSHGPSSRGLSSYGLSSHGTCGARRFVDVEEAVVGLLLEREAAVAVRLDEPVLTVAVSQCHIVMAYTVTT